MFSLSSRDNTSHAVGNFAQVLPRPLNSNSTAKASDDGQAVASAPKHVTTTDVAEKEVAVVKAVIKRALERIQLSLTFLPLKIQDCNDFAFMSLHAFCELLFLDLLALLTEKEKGLALNDFAVIKSVIVDKDISKFPLGFELLLEKLEQSKVEESKKTEIERVIRALKLILPNASSPNFDLPSSEFLSSTVSAVDPIKACKIIYQIQKGFLSSSKKLLNEYSTTMREVFEQFKNATKPNVKSAEKKKLFSYVKEKLEYDAKYYLADEEEKFQELMKLELTSIILFICSNERFFQRHCKFADEELNIFAINEFIKFQHKFVLNSSVMFANSVELLDEKMALLCYDSAIGFKTERSIEMLKESHRLVHQHFHQYWCDLAAIIANEQAKMGDVAREQESVVNFADKFFLLLRLYLDKNAFEDKSEHGRLHALLTDTIHSIVTNFPETEGLVLAIQHFMKNERQYIEKYKVENEAWHKKRKFNTVDRSDEIEGFKDNFNEMRSLFARHDLYLTTEASSILEGSDNMMRDFLNFCTTTLNTIYEIPDLNDSHILQFLKEGRINNFLANGMQVSEDMLRMLLDTLSREFDYYDQLSHLLKEMQLVSNVKNTLFTPYLESCTKSFSQDESLVSSWFLINEGTVYVGKKRKDKHVKDKKSPNASHRSQRCESKVAPKKDNKPNRRFTKRSTQVPLSTSAKVCTINRAENPQDIIALLTLQWIGLKAVNPLKFELANENDVCEIFKHEQAFHLAQMQSGWKLIQQVGREHRAYPTLVTFLLLSVALLQEQTLTPIYLQQHPRAKHDLVELCKGLNLSDVSKDLSMMTSWSRYFHSSKNPMHLLKLSMPKGMEILENLIEKKVFPTMATLSNYVSDVLSDVVQITSRQIGPSERDMISKFSMATCVQHPVPYMTFNEQEISNLKIAYQSLEEQEAKLRQFLENSLWKNTDKDFEIYLKDASIHLLRFHELLLVIVERAEPANLSFFSRGLYYAAANFAELCLIALSFKNNSGIFTHDLLAFNGVCRFDQFLNKKQIDFLNDLSIKKGADYPFWEAYRLYGEVSYGIEQIALAYEETEKYREMNKNVEGQGLITKKLIASYRGLISLSQNFSDLVNALITEACSDAVSHLTNH